MVVLFLIASFCGSGLDSDGDCLIAARPREGDMAHCASADGMHVNIVDLLLMTSACCRRHGLFTVSRPLGSSPLLEERVRLAPTGLLQVALPAVTRCCTATIQVQI